MRTIVCVIFIIAAFVLGIYVGRLPIVSLFLGSAPATQINNGTNSPTAAPAAGSRTISTANLSDGQKKLLSTLGINADTFVITPAMIACAEAKIGAARLAEITSGATPSLSEGFSLAACYK